VACERPRRGRSAIKHPSRLRRADNSARAGSPPPRADARLREGVARGENLRTNPTFVTWLDLHNWVWNLEFGQKVKTNKRLTTWTDLTNEANFNGGRRAEDGTPGKRLVQNRAVSDPRPTPRRNNSAWAGSSRPSRAAHRHARAASRRNSRKRSQSLSRG
jgi:hypothetical protein